MNDTSGLAVSTHGLTRRFKKRAVVDDLTLSVPTGSVFGLLGRNGAGKTTLIRLLLGLLRPDSGRSTVLGEDSLSLSANVRRRIGYLSEEPFPYDDLPIAQTLEFVSGFFPSWNWDVAEDLTRRLAVPGDVTLSDMSAGERRKAELVLVLAQEPDLLILDDPAAGLDAVSRYDFLWAALEVVRDEGRTVLFTSHVLTDVERIVDRVAILELGKVREQGELDDLKTRTKRLVLPGKAGIASTIAVDGEVTRRLHNGDLSVVTRTFDAALLARLQEHHDGVIVEDLNLEEIFVETLRPVVRVPE